MKLLLNRQHLKFSYRFCKSLLWCFYTLTQTHLLKIKLFDMIWKNTSLNKTSSHHSEQKLNQVKGTACRAQTHTHTQKNVAMDRPEEENKNISEEIKVLESSEASRSPKCEKFDTMSALRPGHGWEHCIEIQWKPFPQSSGLQDRPKFHLPADNGPKYSEKAHRSGLTTACESSWVVQQEPWSEPYQTSLERPDSTNGSHWMGTSIQMYKACCTKPKKTSGWNCCQRCFNLVQSKNSEFLWKCNISGGS